MSNIDNLLDLSKRLTKILEDPEPGCFTWHEAAHNLVSEIADFASPKLHRQVREFMKAVGQVILDKPGVPDEATVRLRGRLVMEEAFEFAQSLVDNRSQQALQHMKLNAMVVLENSTIQVNLPEAADALADIDYVVEGSRIAFGIDGAPIAAEVHRANMTKLGGPVINGKVTKPEGWHPPDIEMCLKKQGWET